MAAIAQPMTATQLAFKLDLTSETCMSALQDLSRVRLLTCLNQHANQNRVYWLTAQGVEAQLRFRKECGLSQIVHYVPSVDWSLYGFACHRHRAPIVRALTEPMQPAALRRKACSQNSELRMSANNARDIIRIFLKRGIVRRVEIPKHPHPCYELAEAYRDFQRLLNQAAWRGAI